MSKEYERVYDGKWGKTIAEWNERARKTGLDVDFNDPHVLLGGSPERLSIVIVPFTEEEEAQHAVSEHPAEEVEIEHLLTTQFGLWAHAKDREEDFWVYLGSLVGWGRFSRVRNRFPRANEKDFELVEVRPHGAGQPVPTVRAQWTPLWALRKPEFLDCCRRNGKKTMPRTVYEDILRATPPYSSNPTESGAVARQEGVLHRAEHQGTRQDSALPGPQSQPEEPA